MKSMSRDGLYSLYILVDPTSDLSIMYVGKTADYMARLRRHRYEAKAGATGIKNDWIRSIIKLGRDPIMKVIARMPYEDVTIAEERLIHCLRMAGVNLVNVTGGDGWKNTVRDLDTKKKLSVSNGFENISESSRKNILLGKVLHTARKRDGASSIYKGVQKAKGGGNWRVFFRSRYLGTFEDEVEAALFRDMTARQDPEFGDIYPLNFPEISSYPPFKTKGIMHKPSQLTKSKISISGLRRNSSGKTGAVNRLNEISSVDNEVSF